MNEIETVYETQIEKVESLVIKSKKEVEQADELKKYCNNQVKAIKESLKEDIAKANKVHKDLVKKQKDLTSKYDNAIDVIKKAQKIYMLEEERKQLEIKKQQEEELEIIGEVVTEYEKPKVDMRGLRIKWHARIVDESKIPRTYQNHKILVADMRMLEEIAEMEQGKAIIEGVEFYRE